MKKTVNFKPIVSGNPKEITTKETDSIKIEKPPSAVRQKEGQSLIEQPVS